MRASSKKCSLYKGRRSSGAPSAPEGPEPPAGGNAEQPSLAPRTIKCTLNTLLLDNSILPALTDAAERLNRITFEGAKVLQMIVLDMLSSGTPIPAMDQTYIRRVFQSVSRSASSVAPKTTKDATINRVRDEFALTRPPGAEWTSSFRLGQLLTTAAKAYVVNCQNHVKTNLKVRTMKLIRAVPRNKKARRSCYFSRLHLRIVGTRRESSGAVGRHRLSKIFEE